MSIPEIVGVLGGLMAVVFTILNIRKATGELRKTRLNAAIDASTIDEQRLTIVANSAQVATGFLQDVLKRADEEIAKRDKRIENLESTVTILRGRIEDLEARLASAG